MILHQTCVIPWPSINESGEPEGLADIEVAINEITIPEIGVKVEISPIYCYNLNQQQTLAVSSGEKMDLILCMLETNASYIKNGSVMDLTNLYNQYGSNINETLGEAAMACSVNGQMYTIPVAQLLGVSQGFIMRSDLMEKYGYSKESQTMNIDEFSQLLTKVKEGEGSAFYPIAGVPTIDQFIKYDDMGVSPSTGTLLVNNDVDNIVNLYASDEYAEYAKLLYNWAQAGYINPDATSEDSPANQIAAGNYGGQFSSTQPGQDGWVGNTAGYEMTTITFEGMETFSKTTSLSNISWGISSTCDNPEKAMQLINLMFADNDFGTIMSVGLEGKTHEVVDSNDAGDKIVDFPEGLDMTTVPYYNLFSVWPNCKAQWVPTELSYFDEIADYNSGTEYSPAFGYTFDTTEYTTQLASIDAVVAQYSDTVNGGKADPAVILPEFITALENAGITDVIAANQNAYDAWKDITQ